MYEETYMDSTITELTEIRRDLGRLCIGLYALVDEMHMIRMAYEGKPGDYYDPIHHQFDVYAETENIEPYFG